MYNTDAPSSTAHITHLRWSYERPQTMAMPNRSRLIPQRYIELEYTS